MDARVVAVLVVVVVVAAAEVDMITKKITFQWHITDVCNYRCTHCYQDSYINSGLSIMQMIGLLDKMEYFVSQLSVKYGKTIGHINFTGGEPFLHPDFISLLEEVSKRKKFSFAILSNGYLMADSELRKLVDTKPSFIQISLEGDEKMNDSIRGIGTFKEITRGLQKYRDLKVPVLISFTANAKNYKLISAVVKIARKYKVHKVWSDRYLPSKPDDELLMNTAQVQEFFSIMAKEKEKMKYKIFSNTEVSMSRALQFLVNGGQPYSCSAGNSLFAIMPNADVYPCRRLPIKIGNLVEQDFMEISESWNKQQNNDLDDCKACYYKNSCRGGLKCLSYAQFGNYNLKDPNCWM